MVSTMLNAVPETSENLLPINPSMTGKPAANPAPIAIKPTIATKGTFDNHKSKHPNKRKRNEIFTIKSWEVRLKMPPMNIRITAIPSTYSDRAYNALFSAIESFCMRYVVVQLLMIASKLL